MKLNLNVNVKQQNGTTPLVASDQVYLNLRQQILNGDINPGTALRQDDIAAQNDVSKIPVREALRRLQMEGLVDFVPRKGATVRQIDLNDVLELLDIRLALECRALELSVPSFIDSDIESAWDIHDTYKREVNPENWSNLNREFHHCLLEPCDNRHLMSLLADVEQRMGLLMRYRVTEASGLKRPIKEHGLILDACEQRNIDLAVTLLHKHIETTQKEVAAYYRRKNQQQVL